jgi:hypothetical protein
MGLLPACAALQPAEAPVRLDVLSAMFVYPGHGKAPFEYLAGYRFEVRSSHAITLPPAETVPVGVTAYENGGITTPIQERSAVSWSGTPR